MDKIPTILDAANNSFYKESLLDFVCSGVYHTSDFRDYIEYIVDNKSSLFDYDEFKSPLYDGEEEIISLIIPLACSIWNRIYLHPPSSFDSDKRELLELYFNIDDFIDYIRDILPKSKGLSYFSHIDKTKEMVRLIVDNYASFLNMKIFAIDMQGKIKEELISQRRENSLKSILK